MRVISHLQHAQVPSHDNLYYYYDWQKFKSDPRTKNVDLHISGGTSVNESLIDKSKVNVVWGLEHPNGFWSGKSKGVNEKKLRKLESLFDILITSCKQTAYQNKKVYMHHPNPVDFDNVYKNLNITGPDQVKKSIDVFMCGNSVGSHIRGTSIPCPVNSWYNVIKNYNHVHCNAVKKVVPWKDKQMFSMQSKISVVWIDFLHLTPPCEKYCQKNLPWYKFKRLNFDPGKSLSVIAQTKMKTYDAAMSKSIILCAKSPFYGLEYPYNSAIEDMGLIENEDYLFFDSCKDLDEKIKGILSDYNNSKYKKMVDSAHHKIKKNMGTKSFHEQIIDRIKKERIKQ